MRLIARRVLIILVALSAATIVWALASTFFHVLIYGSIGVKRFYGWLL